MILQGEAFKQVVVRGLRGARLLPVADRFRYYLALRRSRQENKAFVAEHPGFALPPADLAYDAYSHTSWPLYFNSGKEQARYFAALAARYADQPELKLCEWGCGPARILRHLRQFLPARSVELHGFDYNPRTIAWCCENIPDGRFRLNGLAPPLACAADTFDFLYCVSVFTHLSREMHFRWIAELSRVVKRNGTIVLTTHGGSTCGKLLGDERRDYDRGELVVRGGITEGKRCFVTYHPASFVRDQLLRELRVIAHFEGPLLQKGFCQDVWVVRNTKESLFAL